MARRRWTTSCRMRRRKNSMATKRNQSINAVAMQEALRALDGMISDRRWRLLWRLIRTHMHGIVSERSPASLRRSTRRLCGQRPRTGEPHGRGGRKGRTMGRTGRARLWIRRGCAQIPYSSTFHACIQPAASKANEDKHKKHVPNRATQYTTVRVTGPHRTRVI